MEFLRISHKGQLLQRRLELAFEVWLLTLRLEIQKIRQKYLYRVEAEGNCGLLGESTVQSKIILQSLPLFIWLVSLANRVLLGKCLAFDHESMYITDYRIVKHPYRYFLLGKSIAKKKTMKMNAHIC